ncbi:thioredoxin-related transmembrane protein 1-like [Mytilus edulis]|uniref:thioredoxin-related transmembrane protein 1-like n=1 Tax=Mytilus edulis TaxID=6550 RepID=UPI0039F11E4C
MRATACLSVLFVLPVCLGLGKSVMTITDENWQTVLEGEWMLEFMAPWCPACRQFSETWSKLADWSRDLDISVGVVDVTENPGLSGRFLVAALPTIYHIKDGEFRQYKSGRKEDELMSFVDDKKWQEVEPVSWYLSPGSYQMGAVGFFFKLAMKIRSLYTMMTEEYGIPEWGCYVIFAIATIMTGLILGLVIVFLCDFVFPSRPSPPSNYMYEKRKGETNKADDDDQDIIDDTKDSHQNNIPPKEVSEESKQSKEEDIPKVVDSPKSQTRKRNVRKAD